MLIPWGFYLVLAVAFGFMLHVRKRDRQKYSEACRPILGKYTDIFYFAVAKSPVYSRATISPFNKSCIESSSAFSIPFW